MLKWLKHRFTFRSWHTLFILFLIGFITIAAYFGPRMWTASKSLKTLATEQAVLNTYIDSGKKRLAAEEEHPMRPLDNATLAQLQEQLPTEENITRFLVELTSAASVANVTLNGFHVARTEEELDERMVSLERQHPPSEPTKGDESEEQAEPHDTEEEVPEAVSPLLRFDEEDMFLPPTTETGTGELHPIWVDVYLQASYAGLSQFFAQLQQMSRLTEVVAWQFFLPREDQSSDTRVRLKVFYYADDRLVDLPDLPPPNVSGGGGSVDVLPEAPPPPEEEADQDQNRKTIDLHDLPLLIPFPVEPQDGWPMDEENDSAPGDAEQEEQADPPTIPGWIPYPWPQDPADGQQPDDEDGTVDAPLSDGDDVDQDLE